MRIPSRRALVAILGLALAAGVLPAQAAAPVRVTLSPVIVMGPDLATVDATVGNLIATTGVGKVVVDLPLVNGLLAQLTSAEITALKTTLTVAPDAKVLTAGFSEKGSPAPPPSSLVNVFPDVTHATDVVAGGNGGQGVGVAVVDTGVANLPDFASHLQPGVDLSGENNPWLDSYGHGTFVAGLIAGNGASSKGKYLGEAPGADIVPVKVAGKSGATTVSTIIQALQWIQSHRGNVGVINLSLGAIPIGPTLLNPLDRAVEAMWRDDFVVVTSAGNSGPKAGTITSPGDDPLVITVGALEDKHTVLPGDDTVASFSSVGPTASDGWWKPDLIAPGRSLVSVTYNRSVVWNSFKSARIGTTNFVGSGTSFSAAVTSGAAALLLAAKPTASPDSIKAALLTTTDAGPPGDTIFGNPFLEGHGVLNVERAVAEPAIDMLQTVSSVVPIPGQLIHLYDTQLLSSWASDGGIFPIYPALYPYPYSGPATLNPAQFSSTGWNSTGWNSTGWNSTGWNSTGWNSTGWNSTGWNSTGWNSTGWN
jgi:serine protease AprX